MTEKHSLVPRSFFSRKPLAGFRTFGFPDFWGELGEELPDFSQETGLSIWEDEKSNQLNIEAALPGLKPEEINVTIDKGILHVTGEKEETKDQDRKYYKKSLLSFSYRIPLPANIDESHEPTAIYKDGLMRLAFKKTPQSQTKRIPVKKG